MEKTNAKCLYEAITCVNKTYKDWKAQEVNAKELFVHRTRMKWTMGSLQWCMHSIWCICCTMSKLKMHCCNCICFSKMATTSWTNLIHWTNVPPLSLVFSQAVQTLNTIITIFQPFIRQCMRMLQKLLLMLCIENNLNKMAYTMFALPYFLEVV